MKIIVLTENTTSTPTLICEHGLSLLIEAANSKILLDAGSTNAFANNAKTLGIKLEEVQMSVLSHGHYDHSGGFETFFEINKSSKLYMQKSAVEKYFSGNGDLHEIGIPSPVLEHGERFVLLNGFHKLCENIYLVPHTTKDLEQIGKRTKLYKTVNNEITPDDFSHEQSLVFDTEKGLIIFNSCSHGGIINIINEAKQACGGRNIFAYIGGLHLKGSCDGKEICTATDTQLDAIAATVRHENMKLYVMHCTGDHTVNELKSRLGDSLSTLSTGDIVEI